MLKILRGKGWGGGGGRGGERLGGRGGGWQTRMDTTLASPGLTPGAVPAGDPASPILQGSQQPQTALSADAQPPDPCRTPPTSHRPWFLADPRKPAQNRERATASVTMATTKPSLSPVLRSRLSAALTGGLTCGRSAPARSLPGAKHTASSRLASSSDQATEASVSGGTPENSFLF